MDKNVGGLDRTVRLVVGALLVLLAASSFDGFLNLGIVAGLVALVVGLVLLVTGATHKCPINGAAGVDTYEGER